jgi:hypothetical protein
MLVFSHGYKFGHDDLQTNNFVQCPGSTSNTTFQIDTFLPNDLLDVKKSNKIKLYGGTRR